MLFTENRSAAVNVVLRISLRNLLRQKRRNILLGIAIAFGTMILVLAGSFASGISDVLFNKIVVYVAGHVNVQFSEKGSMYKQVFHDGERVVKLIQEKAPGVVKVEEGLGNFCRIIGNGRSDNIIVVGIDMNVAMSEKEIRDMEDNFKVIEGAFPDIQDTTKENPALISVQKATYLNIKKNDIVRIRYRNIHGQDQAGRLTIVGIFKPNNVFMQSPIFLTVENVKKLLGYGEHDIGQLFVTVDNPRKNAVKVADTIHALLRPQEAYIQGVVRSNSSSINTTVFGYRSDSVSVLSLGSIVTVADGAEAATWKKKSVLIPQHIADMLKVRARDTVYLTYKSKFDEDSVSFPLVISSVVTHDSAVNVDALLMQDEEFYKRYFAHWPQHIDGTVNPAGSLKGSALYPLIVPEWELLKRCRTTKEYGKQMNEALKKKYKGTTVRVGSMYETASQVLSLEQALNLITFIAVMVLFFIILIGVVNTLRMTIRERTREIGTVRAIGMQRRDVRKTFIYETLFLSLFSSIAGTLVAFAAMWGLSQLSIEAGDSPLSMLLVNNHLHFVPTPGRIVLYIGIILIITVTTAYFPARRASNMAASDALRHFE